MRLATAAVCLACALLGFAVGFSGVQLARLGDLALTALVAIPLSYFLGVWLPRFHQSRAELIRRKYAPDRVRLRVVKCERDDDGPRAA